VWSPKFTEFIDDFVEQGKRDEPLGHVFNSAVVSGLRVHAIVLKLGNFVDVGTFQGIGAMVLE
jgi:hypothetical protein